MATWFFRPFWAVFLAPALPIAFFAALIAVTDAPGERMLAAGGLVATVFAAASALFYGGRLGHRIADELRSAHRDAEERARRAERLEAEVTAILDAVPAAIWIARGSICGAACGPVCGPVTGNRAGYEMLGLPPGSNVMNPITNGGNGRCRIFLEGRLAVPGQIPIQRAARGEELWGIDLELRSEDGRARHLHGNTVPLRDQAGSITGAVAAFIDITQRREAEAQVAESEERYRTLFHMAPLSVTLVDARTGQFIDFNRVAHEERGYTREELSRLHVWDVSLTFPQAAFLVTAETIMREGRTVHYESLNFRKDGSIIEYLALLHPMRLRGRDYLYGMQLDITDLKKAQREAATATLNAERANEAKSRFLAAVSHDLRQPLQALNLYLGVVANRLGEQGGDVVKLMEHCLSSLNELLTGMLDLSKLEAGMVSPKIDDFAVSERFDRVVSTHAPEAAQKGLRLRQAPSSLIGRTDPLLFERILANLVSNAIRYTERGGVLIGCRRRSGKVWVEVWDTGIGVPTDKINEIFEEFHQLGNPERSRDKGSGLGLAIVRRTAALLGLEIQVSSRLEKGSVFAVELPMGGKPSLMPQREIEIAKVD